MNVENPNKWADYQPERARDKEIYDIELRDGTLTRKTPGKEGGKRSRGASSILLDALKARRCRLGY